MLLCWVTLADIQVQPSSVDVLATVLNLLDQRQFWFGVVQKGFSVRKLSDMKF